MKHIDQVKYGKRLLEHLRLQTTDLADAVYQHNVSDYTSTRQLEDEKAKLFKGFPIFIGFSTDLKNPGDYLTDTFVGIPVLVVRAKDGSLKAFLNMCSHRAAPVASGCGKGARRFICPYHGWAYDAEGRFLKLSMEAGFVDLDKSKLDLQPLPVEEKHGLMWMGLKPGAMTKVDSLLNGLESDFAAYGFEGYHHYKTIVMQKNLNWKLVIDTFLENYHLQVLHGKTIGGAIISHLQLVDAYGACERLIQARRNFEELLKIPEADWDFIKRTAITYVLFPNTFFIMQSDHVEMWRSFPDGNDPGKSTIYFDVYVPEPAESESARRYWDKNIDYGVSIVLGEDFPLGEKSQVAFNSGVRPSITFGRNEPGLINYHQAIKRALGYPPDSVPRVRGEAVTVEEVDTNS
jgi:phenylpropionate dioxygenase-like ring-hydroxylating dioxygenase large terminal subunit